MPDSVPARADTVDSTVLLAVLAKVKSGDFTARMPLEWTGVAGKVADGLNEVIIANQALGAELARVGQVVGKEGRLSQRVVLGGWAQSWSGSIHCVNSLIDDLVRPTVEMQRVIGAVADGDLSKKVSADVQGEMLELKNTINAMVDQLNGFISEVTRVAREVGTEGKLGQAAAVTIEVGGVWKDLTDNVNLMAGNLTGQVRNIAEVTTAVANGDLSKKISIDVKGEFLELKNTVNAMVDQLKTFSGEVTRVAREVGVEGRLGGQAQSKEVGGVWKDLTDNVNQLAANLTNQVRAISDVATAVIEGDLTRQVSVEASGEVALLKDKLNEMIRNLRETTDQNVEQDWLKTNRERFTRMLQGQDDLTAVSSMILSELATLVSAQHGVFYTMTSRSDRGEPLLELQAGYGYEERRHLSTSFRLGEGLVGQCAKEKKRILLSDVPGDYVKINSGLGESPPLNIIVLPVLFEGSLRAVVELASFSRFSETHQSFLDSITESIGIVLSTIQAAGLTESLLKQSQSQAEELRAQQEELRGSNIDLARQAKLLAEQNLLAEQKNLEVEESKRLIEEKVSQLAVSSKYKSEFIANMSHELRTPLNSLLILAQQLEGNPDDNMTDTQVEYASVIHSSGKELLALLNSILDLAKVESGTVRAENADVSVAELRTALLREFEHVARGKGLDFSIDVATDCPRRLVTDPQRLRQILKNLLANAFKFTHNGGVRLQIGVAHSGWSPETAPLQDATAVVALAIVDTGIGIDEEQQQRIFEAFAQGDGTTARRYGGTGLGLSISRELASLLGGELNVRSALGEGSTFTVYLPSAGYEPSLRSAVEQHLSPPPQHLRPVVAQRWTATGARPMPAGSRANSAPQFAGMKVLVVDDDPRNIFAMTALLGQSQAEVIAAESGADAIATLQRVPGIDLVLMDIMMPIMDGYETMRAIRALDRFTTLPIIAVTGKAMAGERQRCLDAGATEYVPKPVDPILFLASVQRWVPTVAAIATPLVTAAPDRPGVLSGRDDRGADDTDQTGQRPRKSGRADSSIAGVKVLVVDDDIRNIFALAALLERGHADVTVVESGAEAIAVLTRTPDVDIVLMDIMMPIMDGYDTIRALRAMDQFSSLPIIAVTGKAVAGERQRCLDAGATDYVPKPVDTAELLAALRPWLPTHARPGDPLVVSGEPPGTSGAPRPRPSNGLEGSAIAGVKVLVVDDDFRNIFAMTAVLERGHADVLVAESGAEAIALLERVPDVGIVLMDIMMPVMDGYDTMRAIRAIDRYADLPIVAVTGKLAGGERQRCLDAGANEYVPKPIDTAELLAALRPWLPTPAQPAA
jgi:CheY-like chemotaxis protein/HAMP domain-containing protein